MSLPKEIEERVAKEYPKTQVTGRSEQTNEEVTGGLYIFDFGHRKIPVVINAGIDGLPKLHKVKMASITFRQEIR